MQAKPFSIGARIEHRQSLINRAQYGPFADHPRLGAADLQINARLKDGRGAYTFCMCPGGTVVAAASEPGGVAPTAMSAYLRDGENANSALLVGVDPSDFGSDDPLGRRRVPAQMGIPRLSVRRRRFHRAGAARRGPARRPSFERPRSVRPTYRPGVFWTSLGECLPRYAYDGLREAVLAFDRRIRGLPIPTPCSPASRRVLLARPLLRGRILHVLPLRPVSRGRRRRICRGITSAAVDGLRCAESLASRYKKP
jgi:uncharacterized FAD-dependent dehydrogenase